MSLYDDLGGDAGIAAVVDALFERIIGDPEFVSWFAAVDVARLKEHQRSFLTVALGGPETYTGRSIRSAHTGMAITPTAFASFVAHLEQAIKIVGADDSLVDDVTRRISRMRAAVVEVH